MGGRWWGRAASASCRYDKAQGLSGCEGEVGKSVGREEGLHRLYCRGSDPTRIPRNPFTALPRHPALRGVRRWRSASATRPSHPPRLCRLRGVESIVAAQHERELGKCALGPPGPAVSRLAPCRFGGSKLRSGGGGRAAPCRVAYLTAGFTGDQHSPTAANPLLSQ